jgi:hypothetical protein
MHQEQLFSAAPTELIRCGGLIDVPIRKIGFLMSKTTKAKAT